MEIDISKTEGLMGGSKFPKMKLAKGEVARCNVLINKFEIALVHYVQGIGNVKCLCKADTVQDLQAIEKEAGRPDECILCRIAAENPGENAVVRPPVIRYACRVLRYRTDQLGKPLMAGGLGFSLEIMIMGGSKFRQIVSKQDEWGKLSEHDISLTCTEAKFQNYDVDIKRDALWKGEKDKVIAFWKEEAPKYKLLDCLADTLDASAIERRFANLSRRTKKEDTPVDITNAAGSTGGKSGGGESFEDLFGKSAKGTPAGEKKAEEKVAESPVAATGEPVSDDFLKGIMGDLEK